MLRDSQVAAVPSLHQQAGNPGALLLFPLRHFESIYSIPQELGTPLFNATKRLATALKEALACEGITVRQNNEPAGDQDVWHYHVHIVPRYATDNYNHEPRFVMPLSERITFVEKLREALARGAPLYLSKTHKSE